MVTQRTRLSSVSQVTLDDPRLSALGSDLDLPEESMAVPKKLTEMGLVSTGEVARRLGVHRATVSSWIKRQMLGSVKVGERYVGVSQEQLATFKKNYRFLVSPDKGNASSEKKPAHQRAKTRR